MIIDLTPEEASDLRHVLDLAQDTMSESIVGTSPGDSDQDPIVDTLVRRVALCDRIIAQHDASCRPS